MARPNGMIAGLVLPLLVLSGCSTNAPRPDGNDQVMRGSLVQSGGQYWFESCLGTAREPVMSLPKQLEQAQQRQSLGEDWPVYIEGMGRREAEGVVLSQGLLAGGTQRACGFGLAGIELRAVSADEKVVFDLTDEYLRVSFVDRFLTLSFKRPDVEREGTTRRWQQEMQGSGQTRHSVSLDVRPDSCKGLRGEWYGLTMEAELNERYYYGCARLGDFANWPLHQRYQTPDSIQTRRIDLSLDPDGKVQWREDYRNDQPLLESEGTWQTIAPGVIQVQLEPSEDSRQEASILMFKVTESGELQLQGFHPAYGRNLGFEAAAGLLRLESGDLDWWR